MLTLPDTDQPLREAEQIARGGTNPASVVQHISLPTPWRATNALPDSIDLTIDYEHSAAGWSAAVTASAPGNTTANNPQICRIQLDAPVALQPVAVKKPWGQEVWFSGIEQRGESSVRQGDATLPLSHYLALAPERLTRRAAPLLLKILDPSAAAGSGNLYFETHDEKREVYVVTRVDRSAWPDGTGAIRLGMNQPLREQHSNDADFRNAYLSAVQRYERIRRKIDEQNQAGRPVAAEDQAHEAHCRAAMEEFTAVLPLAKGDVVQVGPGIPHSLQHGVQVFEFQTPTFERNIISFNQQVLTQSHWDSSYAIANMSLDGPTGPVLETLRDGNGVRVERIVDFDEFLVLRITLASNTSWSLDHSDRYAMLAMIDGCATLHSAAGDLPLHAQASNSSAPFNIQGQANHQFVTAFLPASAEDATLATATQAATVLLALPKPAAAGTIPVS